MLVLWFIGVTPDLTVRVNVLVGAPTDIPNNCLYSDILDIAYTFDEGIDLERQMNTYTKVLRFYMHYQQMMNTSRAERRVTESNT
jgi:hypothetical protein